MEIDNLLKLYKGKKVLVTGHTGFKGSWLSSWLNELGAEVTGVSLDPQTTKDNFVLSGLQNSIPNDIRGDIRNKNKVDAVFKNVKPDFVFHLAAQPLVLESFKNPVDTHETNIMGTINILDAIRRSDHNITSIFITSDKCYDNREWVWGYRESDPMGGYDPYSASKGACELIIASYTNSYFLPEEFDSHQKAIASVRAGNVIGGGDWAENRIVPDFIRAIETGQEIQVRSPLAKRPWQHVLEPLGGYLMLGARLMEDPVHYSGAWNFGPNHGNIVTVKELVEKLIKFYGKGRWRDVSSRKKEHESNLLALDISKSAHILKWHPMLNLNETIQLTVDWYKNYSSENVYTLGLNQIRQYMEKWKS